MQQVDDIILGAGVTGLAYANALIERSGGRAAPLILERDSEPGGYCKTVVQDGFTWDYSGHFFHFRDEQIEAWLRARMPGQEILQVEKDSRIRFAGRDIDFPFQKNIHQLPREDFLRCLTELYFKDKRHGGAPRSFKQLLYQRLGAGIAEAFLVPYNQKLYACDLDTLDVDAMGRFFPEADVDSIFANMERADNSSYNSRFSYPAGGAVQYVNALLSDLPEGSLSCSEPVLSINLRDKSLRTNKRELGFKRLVSTAPLPKLLSATGIDFDRAAFSHNKVLVFNLGFDGPAKDTCHWMYFPEDKYSFYRVGWYSNIRGEERMSLYVELGLPAQATPDIPALKDKLLAELKEAGIVTGQQLLSSHHVLMDPAYVHITPRARAEQDRLHTLLNAAGVFSIGRYGSWTYCSIEDNIIEARGLAGALAELV